MSSFLMEQHKGECLHSNPVQSTYFDPPVRSWDRWYETCFSRAAVSVPPTLLRRGIDGSSDMTIVIFDVMKKIRIKNGDTNDDKATMVLHSQHIISPSCCYIDSPRKNHSPSTRDMPWAEDNTCVCYLVIPQHVHLASCWLAWHSVLCE